MKLPLNRSKQRDKVLELLRGTKSHPTAQWLFAEARKSFPRISLATVYRNLSQLRELGLVQVIDSAASTEDHFDADISAHPHLICENCGRIEDLEIELPSDLDRKVSERLGRPVTGHRLDFFGHCTECSRSAPVSSNT